MAGHSKWAQIKRKKAVTDARRGKRWTRLLKEVTVSARLGGGDPEMNPRLRNAVQDAKDDNVPNDNIERAIKRGTGELEGYDLEEVSYEGYGPGGVAVMVETLTDNRNRTVSELRHLFSKHGGNLGENGCVAWMFDQKGAFTVPRSAMGEEEVMELALELEVEDIAFDEDAYEIHTAPEEYARVREALQERGVELEGKELAMIPQSYVELDDGEAPRVMRLMDALEDQDDVQNVWTNFDLDPEALEERS